jgi:pyrroloquinoline quinone biosynthesis protein E
LALLAELTHRCPLQCPYCYNPLNLDRVSDELDTDTWRRVLREAEEMGVLQVHFSGGEPSARKDLRELVAYAAEVGLYSNLITSGVLLDEARIGALAEAGLDHVQLSFQDTEPAGADRIGGYRNGHRKKLEVGRLIRKAGLPLTINAMMHRQNLDHLPQMIELAVELDAQRIEIAHVQYYGWGLLNRATLIPTRAQL